MGKAAHLTIAVEHGRLLAVAATVSGGRVRIRSWLCEQIPGRVDTGDATTLGNWIRERLKEADLAGDARRGVVFTVGRGEVVLKRLAFPAATTPADLPDMVRLQMARQMTVSGEGAAIDFAPLASGVAVPAKAAGGGAMAERLEVLAAALSEDRLSWRREVARAAGMRLHRVALGSMGTVALVAPAAQRRNGATLGVSLSYGSCEFVVIEGGRLVFARATDLDRAQAEGDVDAFAEQVAVEARRTWMSYRVTHESSEIEAITVVGDDELAQRVAARCEQALQMQAAAAALPEFVEAPETMTSAERAAFAPLAGLLAERVMNPDGGIDFLHPRQAPDRREKMRRQMLVAVMGLIAVFGGFLTYRAMTLRDLEFQRQQAVEAERKARTAYTEFMRRRAHVDFAEQWVQASPDWLAHMDHLYEVVPRGEMRLSSLSAEWEANVVYQRPEKRGRFWYTEGKWTTAPRGSIRIAGSTRERTTADRVRESLVSDSTYVLATRGADVPDRFDWTLETSIAVPKRSRPTVIEFGAEEDAIR